MGIISMAFICMLIEKPTIVTAAVDFDIQTLIVAKKSFIKEFVIPIEKVKKLTGFISQEQPKSDIIIKFHRGELDIFMYFNNSLLPGRIIVESNVTGVKNYYELDDKGELDSYNEAKNGKLSGISMFFGDNGNITDYAEFIDGRFFGRQIKWNENGKELERIINDGSKVFVIGE